jgi:D-glycero-D-manno-heptose 1,7-bisphosphate phosphatase
MSGPARRAVFLDRDGVLNEPLRRDGRSVSPRRPEDFRVVPGVDAALRRLRARGLLVFVVTNQPDVARGHLDPAHLAEMSAILRRSVAVDEIAVCPHDDADHCGCRKPKPGMVLALAHKWGVDLSGSFMIGDSWKDVEAGRRAGCRTILVEGHDRVNCLPDRTVSSLGEAVAIIETELDAAGDVEAHGIRS